MSWVVIKQETGEAVCELFDSRSVARLNTERYAAVEAREYLQQLTRKLNGGLTYRDKRGAGLI
jgi:hypothetical protein